jgi:hypothetical protein
MMAICRCQNHPDSQSNPHCIQPVGYPNVNIICGKEVCQEPGLIWLTNDEVVIYNNGHRDFIVEGVKIKLIDNEKEYNLPPILYKYISWDNEHHKKILTENEIFFSSPSNFNDPFDSSISVHKEDIEQIDDDKALEICRIHIKQKYPNLSEEEVNDTANKRYDKNLKYDHENIIFAHKIQQDASYENFGIFSLSEIPHNILMWSHYANSHRGICIGFSTSILKSCFHESSLENRFSIMPRKVEYRTDRPKFEPLVEAPINFYNQFSVKSIDWQYEKEWRYILLDRTNYKVKIPQEAICTIILGGRISRNHRLEIIEILRSRGKIIELKECWISLKKFRLEPNCINYFIRHD